ncbi:hypothetical protein CF15_04115 [Pyrodictium occultum]|uniref:6-pyruvoyl tetrahydropterin synthase n=1 Tax=Pyrodictium occultum TaxID=2309 RepID=A0A0V8RVA7_PYROC|nr:6-carboxytetrahydropterin synthase [Pyrodictium occultum]KSW11982.1 hypothetical protein CF15_04115 [Pyrodictium occultum]
MPLGVCVSTWISVALRVESLGGAAASLHGHDYRVKACVEDSLAEDNTVIDHYRLLSMLEECASSLDHRYLNEALGVRDATAEILVSRIRGCLEEKLASTGRSLHLVYLEACTATGYCSYYRAGVPGIPE